MAQIVPKCACGCGIDLGRGRRGPAPQYASAACRKRAERRRTASITATVAGPPPRYTPADELVVHELVRARGVAFALQRLGDEAPPEVGARCRALGDEMLSALAETFGDDLAR